MTRSAIAATAASILVGCAGPAPEADCDAPGAVCAIAGMGDAGYAGDGEAAREATLYGPMDVVPSPDGSYLVIVDWNNHKLRTVRDGVIDTIIGTSAPLEGPGLPEPGGTHGLELGINHPTQAEFGPDGMLYFAGWHNHRVLRWNPDDGVVTHVAGISGGFSGDGGDALDAQMEFPSSLVFSKAGDLYVIDQGNMRVRMVTADGVMDTVAGTGHLGLAGDGGSPMEAAFAFAEELGMQNIPAGAIEIDDDGMLWVLDSFNSRLRRVDLRADHIDSPMRDFYEPRDLEIGPDGRLYVADTHNYVIRAIDPVTMEDEVVVGTGVEGFGEDGTTALEFDLGLAHGLDFAPDGAMLVADTYNHRVLRVAPGF